jgi:hypothetical protein
MRLSLGWAARARGGGRPLRQSARQPATGRRECVDVIRAAAEISAFSKAKICIERQGEPSLVQFATEQVIALATTAAPTPSCTEDIVERFHLAAWA